MGGSVVAEGSTASARGETILVVEDEAEVLRAAARILTNAGYQVLTAEDADEALLLWDRDGARIDLVLTDVIMPHMSGTELAKRLKEMDPTVKVAFTSGYMDSDLVQRSVLDRADHCITKPFSPADLERTVRVVLDRR